MEPSYIGEPWILLLTKDIHYTDLACMKQDPLTLKRDGTLAIPFGLISPPPNNATNLAAIAAGSFDALALVGNGPPVFTEKSLNRTVSVGETAFFRALAIGALPLVYQWNCNETNIPGATNTFLAVTNVQLSQAGNYYSLIASNALGMATNNVSTLNVTAAEAYILPQTISIGVGGTATFTTGTFGQGPFTYQWQFNGTNLDSATNASLICSNVQFTNAGNYSVLVTNAFGNVSASSSLTVQPFTFALSSTNPLLTTNGLQLQLTGVFATNAVILYASTDLVSWLPILTNSAATGAVQFLDSAATNLPLRFYRTTEQ